VEPLKVPPKVDFWDVKQGTRLNDEDTWEWNITTPPNKLCRVPINPFCLTFEAKAPNRYHKTGAAVKDKEWNDKATGFLTPQDKANPGVFLEDCLGPSALFRSCEILVNQLPLTAHEMMGQWQHLYSTINRVFTTKAHQLKKYNRTFARVSTSHQRHVKTEPGPTGDADKVRVTYMSKEVLESMKLLQFDGKNESTDKYVRFGIDGEFFSWFSISRRVEYEKNASLFSGVFPLDCQCNILTALTGVDNENGYLPPGEFCLLIS
jgi:hypothetical protein